jgi:hypothetical protein
MEAQAIDRKAMQAAVKNINDVLGPKPKLQFIAPPEKLEEQIVSSVAACIGEDEGGNPVWTDKRAESLAKETIDTYEAIVKRSEAKAKPKVAEPAPEAKAEPEVEECPGFVKSLGPKEGDEACTVCSRVQECTERAAPKKEHKKRLVEMEEAYSWIHAVCDAIKSGPKTRDQVADEALRLYIENGGSGDKKGAERNTYSYLRPLIVMGYVKDDNGILTLVK